MVMLLLPVALLLFGLGAAGFFYARGSLLDQWRESAVLSLERASHGVDMRLGQPEEAVKLINSISGLASYTTQEWEEQLSQLPGVARVKLTLLDQPEATGAPREGGAMPGMGMGRGQGAGGGGAAGPGRGWG